MSGRFVIGVSRSSGLPRLRAAADDDVEPRHNARVVGHGWHVGSLEAWRREAADGGRLSAITLASVCSAWNGSLAADAEARPEIMRWLRDRGVPFIDVGMSFREGQGGLTGIAKVTAYRPGDETTLPITAALQPGEDDYSSNVQIAELNALNATLAVIQWKRYLGFYATHTTSNQTVYKLYLNELRNGNAQ